MQEDAAMTVTDICTVLTPIRAATQVMQRSGVNSSASMYLPIYAGVLRQLSTDVQVLRVPPLCATFVAWHKSDEAGGRVAQSADRSVSTADLCMLATDLRAWLHQDMMKMKKKHMELGDPAGLKYLQHASLLDPRFKHRTELFLGRPEEVDQCKQDLKTHIVKRSEAYKHLPLAKDSVLVVEVEAHEDGPVLKQLRPQKGTKRKQPQTQTTKVAKHKSSSGHSANGNGAVDSTVAKGAGTLDEMLYGGAALSVVLSNQRKDLAFNVIKTVQEQVRIFESMPGLATVEDDPLEWWRTRAWQVPHLAMAARDSLGTPGSSHALERAFSSAGRGVNHKRRPNLSRRHGAAIIFCHENVQRSVL